jgi:thioredoxin 1
MVAFITELNESNYDTTVSTGYVLVDIWATWCGPCRIISPIIDELSNEYQGRLTVGKLDADANKDKVSELGVRNIPTILLYKDGEIIDKSIGAATKVKLKEMQLQKLPAHKTRSQAYAACILIRIDRIV